MKEFFTTLQGKAIAFLTIIALLFGIGAEGASMYRNAMEGVTAQAIARESAARQEAERREKQALAEKTAAEQRTAEAVANESRLRQEAERREKQALAEKTAAEQRTAEAVANESRLRQEAERREKQALAEKTSAEQRTAEAIADVSRQMQAANVAAKEAEAKKVGAEAVQQQVIACAFDPANCTPEQRRIVGNDTGVGSRLRDLSVAASDRLAGDDNLWFRKLTRLDDQGSGASAAAQQLSPKCRQHFAEWQAYTSHAAFAFVPDTTIGCAWNGGTKNVIRGSTAQAIGALKDYCNDKNFVCTIIATK